MNDIADKHEPNLQQLCEQTRRAIQQMYDSTNKALGNELYQPSSEAVDSIIASVFAPHFAAQPDAPLADFLIAEIDAEELGEVVDSVAAPTVGLDAAQAKLNSAVMYALKEGCFFPVPEPKPGATVRNLIQWGAMRNLHDAIAQFNNATNDICYLLSVVAGKGGSNV